MIYQIIIETLSFDIILFINNYFTKSRLAIALKIRRIIIYKTIKYSRINLLELLIEIKTVFIKDISYETLTAVTQNDILYVI